MVKITLHLSKVIFFTKMKHFHSIIIKVVILVFCLSFSGCIFQKRASKAEKQAYKMQVESEKESQKEYQREIDAHFDKQSDEAQKMMKKMQKRRRKNMTWRRRSWFRENF